MNFDRIEMSRVRYWKLTSDELEKFNYNTDKILNWEIKCYREPREDAIFVGVFLFRHGTPVGYESIKGISYYYNHIPINELPEITKFLKSKFGGKEIEKGDRFILKESKEIYSGKEIAELAKEMETRFKTTAIISLEFENLTDDEKKDAGLPDAKLLPIAGK